MKKEGLIGMATAVLLAGCGNEGFKDETIKLADCQYGPNTGSYSDILPKSDSIRTVDMYGLGEPNDKIKGKDIRVISQDGVAIQMLVFQDPQKKLDISFNPGEGDTSIVRVTSTCKTPNFPPDEPSSLY